MVMKQTRRQFVRTLFVATQAAAIGSLFPHRLFAADAQAGGLNFIVFGDWGRNGELDQLDVATQMGVAAKEMQAKFIISVGDNFYENGVVSVDDLQWQSSFESVYTAPSLRVPWWVALGNHDYHGNCEAQIEYHKVSPRWNMPARYYVRSEKIDDATTADFFYLDTTPMVRSYYRAANPERTRANVMSQDVPKQLAWFKAALAASKAQWKIVIGHHPIYSGGGLFGHGDTKELIENILPLLEEYQVPAYFNGHDHNLQHLQAGTVNMFDSGAGSKVRPVFDTQYTKFAKARSGFTAVALQADRMDIRMIDDKGRLLYTTTVPRVST
jgi:tartrate-resistant acid phosphatase type 5